MLYEFLTDDGLAADASNYEANVDGSETAVPFYYTAVKDGLRIRELNVQLQSKAAQFSPDRYGDIPALANGVRIEVRAAGPVAAAAVLESLVLNVTIQTVAHWARFAQSMFYGDFGSNQAMFQAHMVFLEGSHINRGEGLYLHKGQHVVALIQDDLTGLNSHTFVIQ